MLAARGVNVGPLVMREKVGRAPNLQRGADKVTRLCASAYDNKIPASLIKSFKEYRF